MICDLPSDFLIHPIAHRALHDLTQNRPENSAAAVQAAVQAGFGIEIDVQLTSDEEPVVFHDYDLSRLTGVSGLIRQRSASDLQSVPLSGGAGAGIPLLGAVLEMIDGKVPLLIEIKDQDGALGPNVGTLEEGVARAIKDYSGPVAVMSFNPHSVAAMQSLLPDVPRGLVSDNFHDTVWNVPDDRRGPLTQIEDYDRVGASFISHSRRDLDNPRVSELKAQGARILTWTIRSEEQEHEARRIAENITFEGYLPSQRP